MGFGAILTRGERHQPLDDALMGWIIEARVEQSLSEATKVAVRFEDDLCDGGSELERRGEFQPGQILGIFVQNEGQTTCLGYGPVTRVRTSSMVGGTGSWLEVSFSDIRETMDRTAVQATYTGKASDAVRRILETYEFGAVDCEDTRKEYSSGADALSQRASDLAFVVEIARKNNFDFWLTYAAAPLGPVNDEFVVVTTAHLKSSPPRPDRSGIPLGDLVPAPPSLSPDPGRNIRINPPPGECVSVGKFDVQVDYDRPNAARGFAQDATSGDTSEQTTSAPEDALDGEAQPVRTWANSDRQVLVASEATDPLDQFLAQEAELTEAAWFVEADASATLAQLGFVIEPHQVVEVLYAGDRLSGPYQVMSTVHVINAADHYIDFKLRANGLRTPEGSR